VWKGDGGKAITSFAIVTTDAAPSVAQYHNRMPVVLDDSQFDDWMRGTPDQAAALMGPYAGAATCSFLTRTGPGPKTLLPVRP
jgi:putative SOS response-associated peptidase YedK